MYQDEFYKLPFEKQLEETLLYGNFRAVRKELGYTKNLYMLHQFYVELWLKEPGIFVEIFVVSSPVMSCFDSGMEKK